MKKKNQLMTFVPTMFYFLDIILGENKRDEVTLELDSCDRGYQLGRQYGISGNTGSGKSTLDGCIWGNIVHQDLPLLKVLIFDTDNSWYPERIRKLTNLPLDVVNEKFTIYTRPSLEFTAKELKRLHEEYKKAKHTPVEVIDYYTGETKKMMPFYMIEIDTVSAMKSDSYGVDAKDNDATIAKQANLQKFLGLDGLSNSIEDFFEGNVIINWVSHLKDNTSIGAQQQPEKEFKSAANNKKSTVPNSVRRKYSSSFRLMSDDSGNIESNSHPINKYKLDFLDTKAVYASRLLAVKSRTGKEAMTSITFAIIDGVYDKEYSMITTALDLGIIKLGTTRYPRKDVEHIFKNTGTKEEEIMGRSNGQVATIEGYDREFNLREAYLIMKYTGTDERLNTIKDDFVLALMNKSEEVLAYELEANTISRDEMEVNTKRMQTIMSVARKVNRAVPKKFIMPDKTLGIEEDEAKVILNLEEVGESL